MIYAAADLHLVRHVWRSRKDLEGDSYRALEAFGRAVLQDKTEEEKAVILAGDLFDAKKVDGFTLDAFCRFSDMMYDEGIPVWFVQGNHEDNDEAPIAVSCGAEHLQGRREIDGRIVYGIDYCPREVLLNKLQEVGECDLLVLHCAMEHLVGFSGACDLSMEEIPNGVRNVVVGDIHVQHALPLPGRGYCVSPGPLHPCNIAQGGPKGFYKLPAGSDDFEFVEIPARDVIRVDVSTKEELAGIAFPALRPGWPLPILELKYAEDLADEATAFIKQHGGKNAVIFDAMQPTPVDLDFPEELGQEETLTLVNVMPHIVKDPDMLEFCQAMASNPDNADRIITNKLEELLNDQAT